MKVAYFDCFSGISGNMILGALVDLGLDIEELRAELGNFPLQGYQIEARRVSKKEISAIYVEVVTPADERGRTLRDILNLIDQSTLNQEIKGLSRQIFIRLGEAEARIHDQDLDVVHFHEIGKVDTIVDILGTLIGLKKLGIERVSCSPLNVGKGFIRCSHGTLPIPAPITAELLKGVPVYTTGVEGELTTPTGAAIITGIAADFCDLPPLNIQKSGYGAGKMDLEIPNLLRVFIGEALKYPATSCGASDVPLEVQTGPLFSCQQAGGYPAELSIETASNYITEQVTIIETNIDDMNPQFYGHVVESLWEAGALDVFLTPVQMKKNRPGVLLSVIAPKEQVGKLLDTLFEESTTLGVRISETRRLSLPRSLKVINTKFGQIQVKVARQGNTMIKVVPEYDDCRKAANAYKVPVSQVYAEVQRAWQEATTSPED